MSSIAPTELLLTLAEPTRLRIVNCLAAAPLFVSDLQAVLGLPPALQWAFCIMWATLGIIAVVQEVVWTTRAARKRGGQVDSRPVRIAIFSLSPCVFIAAVLTLKLLLDGHMRYVVPVWMMCYGAGVYAAGLFSIRLPRLLGLAFVAMGAVGLLFCPELGLALAALSFGLLHVLFGLAVQARSRQDGDQ